MQDPNGSSEDETEDTIEMVETPPAAPQPKRTDINAHPRDRIVATRLRALSAKAGEHLAPTAAALSQGAAKKTTSTTNMQIKVLTDLVKSLLKAMEEQKEEHANQIETLTKTFTQQIETVKAQVTEMTEKIEA